MLHVLEPQNEQLACDLRDNLQNMSQKGFSYLFGNIEDSNRAVYSSFSTDWVKAYTENEYYCHDPILAWSLNHTGALSWKEVPRTPQGEMVMRHAHEMGLEHGTVVSFRYFGKTCLISMSHEASELPQECVQRSKLLGKTLASLYLTDLGYDLPETVLQFAKLLTIGVSEADASKRLGITRRTGQNWKRRIISKTASKTIHQAIWRIAVANDWVTSSEAWNEKS